MARTDAGRGLTALHRRSQLAIRSQTLRDFRELWPLWTGDEATFRRLVKASEGLVDAHRASSSALAMQYLSAFRRVEDVGGSVAIKAGSSVNPAALETSLYVTGRNSVRRGLAAGFSPQAARSNALVEVSGAITRHVLAGGRDAILRTVAGDRAAEGWTRVPGGTACSFCAMLSTRGATYAEDTAGFQAHDHCTCTAEPVYAGSERPPETARYSSLWNEAGRGVDGPAEHRRAFRRLLAANN